MEELAQQLKEEKQRALDLEGLLRAANVSLQTLDKVHQRDHNQGNERVRKQVFRLILFCFSCKRGSQTWKEKGIS